MPICTTCSNWYALRSRIPATCRECESKELQRLAREVDPRAMSITELASWGNGHKPMKYKRRWEVK